MPKRLLAFIYETGIVPSLRRQLRLERVYPPCDVHAADGALPDRWMEGHAVSDKHSWKNPLLQGQQSRKRHMGWLPL